MPRDTTAALSRALAELDRIGIMEFVMAFPGELEQDHVPAPTPAPPRLVVVGAAADASVHRCTGSVSMDEATRKWNSLLAGSASPDRARRGQQRQNSVFGTVGCQGLATTGGPQASDNSVV